MDQTVMNGLLGLATVVGSVIGAYFTYRNKLRAEDQNNWVHLHNSYLEFQKEIRDELRYTKTENVSLQKRIDELENQVRNLLSENEKLASQKLLLVQKGSALQTLLQYYIQSEASDPVAADRVKQIIEELEKQLTKENL